jgi:hypothetical protein
MRATRLRCLAINLALAWVGLITPGTATPQAVEPQTSAGDQRKDDEKLDEKQYDIPYWNRSESFQVRAAAAVIGEGGPLGALAARVAISENVPTVRGWEFYFDKALPINRSYLDAIRDGRVLPDVRAKELIDLKVPDRGLYLAYLQALRRAHAATEEMFRNSAEEHAAVVYTHLAEDPKLYRGEIITVKGKVTAIHKIKAPPLLWEDGITSIYEAYIIGPRKGVPPYAVLFTELPKDLSVSEKLDADVTFHGYFLSIIRIPADKERGATKKDLICPWLIGKTLLVAENRSAVTAPPAADAGKYEIALYTVGIIIGITAALLALNLYVRRSDRKTQDRLAELRERRQPFPLDDGPPPENGFANPPD